MKNGKLLLECAYIRERYAELLRKHPKIKKHEAVSSISEEFAIGDEKVRQIVSGLGHYKQDKKEVTL